MPLFEDTFLVHGRLPIRFIAPAWAKGFKCLEGNCGLCCVTDPPPNMRKMRIDTLENSICGVYVTKSRRCKKYQDRPIGCLKYPFMIGIEPPGLSLSVCLSCPSTNSQDYTVRESVEQMFLNKSVTEYVMSLAHCYNSAASRPEIWRNAVDSWKAIGDAVRECVVNDASFPLRPRIQDVSIKTVAHLLGISEPPMTHPPLREALRTKFSGIYIATRFHSNRLCSVRTIGRKTRITLFDSDFGVVKDTGMEAPTSPIFKKMNAEARNLLRDYVDFLVKRPFTSLAAYTSAFVNGLIVPFNILSEFIGNFEVLDAGATLIAMRDDLIEIDAESFREIISFSDGVLNSTFNNPQVAIEH